MLAILVGMERGDEECGRERLMSSVGDVVAIGGTSVSYDECGGCKVTSRKKKRRNG